MKNEINVLISSLIVLAVIISSSILIMLYLNKSSEAFIKELDNLELYIDSSQWKAAQEHIENLNTKWEKTENIWSLYTNHHEIDNITISLRTLNAYIVSQNVSESKSSLASLKHYISHIPKMENLSLRNIF